MTKSTVFRLTALAGAALLGACSLTPNYQRPGAPVATSFPGASTGRAASAVPSAADLPWQDYFTDAQLRRLITLALANNRDLRVAMLNVEQTRAQFQIQRSNQLPSVGVAASAARATSPVTGNVGNSFTVGLALTSWEIDFFGRLGSLKQAALARYLASDEGRKAAQISLVAATASGWLNLLADQELLELTRQTLATREESQRLMQLRFSNGVSSELELRQAESLTESARATLAQQQRQRAQNENALVLLIGQSLPAELAHSLAQARLSSTNALAAAPAGLPSEVLVRRPDILQAEQLLIAANANIGAARAAFFPRIALTASAGTASSALSGLFDAGTFAWSLAPQLLLPIFDGGLNRANLDATKVAREIAIAQYERSIQSAFREVADALAGSATWGEQLRALQAQAQAESARVRLSELTYRNGVASYLNLLDAQRALFGVQQAALQTQLAQQQNQVALYRSLGGGWHEKSEQYAQAKATSAASTPAVRAN